MLKPPLWTTEGLERDRQIAIETFRRERIEEPLEIYLELLDDSRGHIEELLEITVDLKRLREEAPRILQEEALRTAFRYLAGPPISMDDLQILIDGRLSAAQVRKEPARATAAAQMVLDGIDRGRFPWVAEDREPTEQEMQSAALATAVLIAASKTGTKRRSMGQKQQEAAVSAALTAVGFESVNRRTVRTLADAPSLGQFCPESVLGTRKADFVIRLHDGRVMAVECKVSNSSVNSIKRLNNDAAVKAEVWARDFGLRQVVPTAVLSGVYDLRSLTEAQERGLTLIWAHDLGALTDWLERTRT